MVFILYKLYVLLPYTYPIPKLSPHRRLCISTLPKNNHSVWFISVLKSGDMGKCPHKSPSPCNTCHTCVIIQIDVLLCHKNACAQTHTHTHTHTHTYTHTHTHTHTLYLFMLYVMTCVLAGDITLAQNLLFIVQRCILLSMINITINYSCCQESFKVIALHLKL